MKLITSLALVLAVLVGDCEGTKLDNFGVQSMEVNHRERHLQAQVPSKQPSSKPSRQPSKQPSSKPSKSPSRNSSNKPSRKPSKRPSQAPSRKPVSRPRTGEPTFVVRPTKRPSSKPSKKPSRQPSSKPSLSLKPSKHPSMNPSRQPSSKPSKSYNPSSKPSSIPSAEPSSKPSPTPSAEPSLKPTVSCAPSFSQSPSPYPSNEPSVSDRPSVTPSLSKHPSNSPTISPTISTPTAGLSSSPTFKTNPSESLFPTKSSPPSLSPSFSKIPTVNPSLSGIPSQFPTFTAVPTKEVCFDEQWVDADGDPCKFYDNVDAGGNEFCTLFGDKYQNNGLVANQACCVCGGGNTTHVISDVVTLIFEGEFPGCEPPSTTAAQFDESFEDFLSTLLKRPSKLIESSSINISVVGASCYDEINNRRLSQLQEEDVYATTIIVTKVTIEKTTLGQSVDNIIKNIVNDSELSDQLAVELSEDVDFFNLSGGFLDISAAPEVPSTTPTFVVHFPTFEPSSDPSIKAVTPPTPSRKELRGWKTTAIVLATLLGLGVAASVGYFLTKICLERKKRNASSYVSLDNNSPPEEMLLGSHDDKKDRGETLEVQGTFSEQSDDPKTKEKETEAEKEASAVNSSKLQKNNKDPNYSLIG